MLLIIIVVEISSSLLIISGLDKKIARFQAISMLTATGFTTKESELILRHPIRRNIGMFLILFGVFSLAVLISSISKIMEQNFRIPQMVMITTGMLLILVTVKNKPVMKLLSRKFHQHLRQEFELHELPIEEVLYTGEEDMVSKISIFAESRAVDQPVVEMFNPDDDFLLLFVQRGSEKIRHQCMKLTLQEGDILFVYGSKTSIEGKFGYELERMKKENQDESLIAGL
jgi:hypothetical protein